jgi:hypothetical protein
MELGVTIIDGPMSRNARRPKTRVKRIVSEGGRAQNPTGDCLPGHRSKPAVRALPVSSTGQPANGTKGGLKH